MEFKTILIDMDGVLTDFDEGVCRVFGLTPYDLEQARQPGVWNLCPALSIWLQEEVTETRFWSRVEQTGADFWVGLERTKWFMELLQLVEGYQSNWHIITSPGYCHTSYSGKARWLKSQFGRSFTRWCPTPHKELFAQEGVLLIDDKEENCKRFVEAGGHAILFPHIGNHLHTKRDDPIQHVREELKRLTDYIL